MKLFCLPYAGGSAARIYRAWMRDLPDWLDVCPLELPGRGLRATEGLHSSIEPLLNDLLRVVLPASTMPYALFGHSLGGLLAFELARRLEHVHGHPPAHLMVSGYEAPEWPKPADRDHLLPDDEFRLRLRELAGTPDEILDNDDLMDVVVPVLRADFAVANTYRFASPWLRLSCPLTVLGGVDDPEAPPPSLRDWRRRTTGPFQTKLFAGNHFYLNDDPVGVRNAVLELVRGAGLDGVSSTHARRP
jgi:surfactin synthase thioesterase subunit